MISDKNKSIIETFTAKVKKNPDKVAISFHESQLTYNELDIISKNIFI